MENKEFSDEEPQDSRLKRVLIIAGAIIAILIILSYSITGIVDLPGLLGSKKVITNQYQGKIVFLNDTLEEIQEEYLGNQEREIKACLYGNILDGKYYIDRVEFPEIFSASVAHITATRCTNAIIDLHSHPWYRCSASKQDIKNLGRLRAVNPEVIMLVMCGTDRFSLYD